MSYFGMDPAAELAMIDSDPKLRKDFGLDINDVDDDDEKENGEDDIWNL